MVSIADILNGNYIVESGWEPNYVLLSNGKKVSRVNLLGVIVDLNMDANFSSIELDDGTGTIGVRIFEKNNALDNFKVGDALMLIGRPRVYSNQTYIFPEIMKMVENRKWIEVRKLQLKKLGSAITAEKQQPKEEIQPQMEDVETGETNTDKIHSLIKELDKGNGASFEDVIERSGIKGAEQIIDEMLKKGEIYEVKGRLRVI